MSLLTATIEDVTPKGRLLPEGVYRVQVEEAGPKELEQGKTQLERRYGQITTREGQTEFQMPDGSTFRIGNRKLFKRSWIDHPNTQAAQIGNSEIKREAIAAGLMQKPEKGQSTELEFDNWGDYAQRLVGREFLVRVKHKTRTKNGEPVKDPDTQEPIVDAEVVEWLLP